MFYADIGDYDKAEYHLLKTLEIDSTMAGGLLNLGFFYSEKKEYERALNILDQAVEQFPDQPIGYNNRGDGKTSLR